MLRRLRKTYDRLCGKCQPCRFCAEQTRREEMKAGACPPCVRENLAWIAEVDGWTLCRDLNT